jgi:predicted CXXCH cytochrome family protein
MQLAKGIAGYYTLSKILVVERNGIMKKAVIALAVSVVLSAGLSLADDKTIVLPAKPGNVTFEHSKHKDVKNACLACHSSEKGGKIEGFGKEKAHNICKGCHEQTKAGPTKCSECHKK